MQHFLKAAVRTARARIVPAELLFELFISVHDLSAFLHAGFRWETLASLACDLERTIRLDWIHGLPYEPPGLMVLVKLVRKPGFAPGPFASRAKMLLLHHNPALEFTICD